MRRPNLTPTGATRLLVVAVCFALASCASPRARDRQADRAAPPAGAIPESVQQAMMPRIELPKAPAVEEERFDVAVQGMDAAAFFNGLVDGTPYSIALAPDLASTPVAISLNLKSVTVDEVVRIVREVYGLAVRKIGQTYFIGPPALQTRTYRVDYLTLSRTGLSRTRVTSGQITSQASGGDDESGDGDSGESTSVSAGTVIQTNSHSEFWTELRTSLQTLVNRELGEMIVVSPESGVVVARAFPDRLRAIEEFLEFAHANLHEEVVIEAKIVEVNLGDGLQTGINWGALRSRSGNQQFAGVVGGDRVFTDGTSAIAGAPLDVGPGNAINSFASSAAGGALFLALDFNDFNGVFEFLQSQGDVRVLSSPRIATVNNQKAVIKVGTDEFFVTGIKNNTTTGNNPVNNTDIELTPFFSGVALDVTPRIFGDGNDVILHVHPSVSEVTDSTKEIIVQDQVQRLPLAISNLRETDSIIRAKSGQIVVIGGLIRETESDDEFRTPGLSDIPLFGELFRQRRKRSSRSELVILLKPTVVANSGTWDAELRRVRERLRRRVPDDWTL